PNPTTDVLNIKSEAKINKVSVTDVTGRNIDVKLNENTVDVRHLPAGTYLISIETKDGLTTEKFIKK
ncbi:T9SS type A sorting domain-containing protein, partial [uncultured Chryseobacterium sp.]|uniref:T9SS type A sorting domain-containing protein n=1 Tax=uncultured Chryseobacterium sp. TaxID=259322 RepID=UPI002629D48D